jgi:hypothetical protein
MRVKPVTYAPFSLLKASEGGMSFDAAKARLAERGVTGVRRGHSPYIGHYGMDIPKRYEKRARTILWGRT